MELLPGLNRVIRRALILQGVTSAQADVQGLPLHYYRAAGAGPGPEVVLVHGLGGSANGFYKVLLPLSKRFSRVWAPDLPGCGFSLLPTGAQALSAHRQVEILTAFLEEVVRAPAVLVGTSLGGAVCATVARQRPDLVSALALVAPAGAQVPEDRLRALIQSFDVRTSADARALTRRLFHRPPLFAWLFAGDLRRMYAAEAVKGVLSRVTPQDALDPEVLRGLGMPTLLIWGESEKLLPNESLDFFRAHLPPHAEVQLVPGFGHVPHVERPGEWVRRLWDFVRTARAAPARM